MSIRKATKENVYQTCENLLQDGVDINSITNYMVYDKLGNQGSYSTISPLVKEWKTERFSQALDTVSMPSEVENIGHETIRRVWKVALDKAYKHAEGKLEDYYKLAAEKNDIENILTKTEKEIDELTTNYENNNAKYIIAINALRDRFNLSLGATIANLENKSIDDIFKDLKNMQTSMLELFDQSIFDQQQLLSDYINKKIVGDADAIQANNMTDSAENLGDAERLEQANDIAKLANEI